jgi:hypothetical protein
MRQFQQILLMLPGLYFCPKCKHDLIDLKSASVLIQLHYSTKQCPNCNNELNCWELIMSALEKMPDKFWSITEDLAGFFVYIG